eukprot:8788617-Ditylum_brightwellii.AAC.1
MTKITWPVNIYLDNEGAIYRYTSQILYPYDYSHHTLELDWDVIDQTVQVNKQFNDVLHMNHMKGHQDDSTVYNDLPLPDKLNGDADMLAGTF